jgi:Leucine-rich repeat (LRR) protein
VCAELFKLPCDLVRNILRRTPTRYAIGVSRHTYVVALATRAELRVTRDNEHLLCLLPALANVHSFAGAGTSRMAALLPHISSLRQLRRLSLEHATLFHSPARTHAHRHVQIIHSLSRLCSIEHLNLSDNCVHRLPDALQKRFCAALGELTTLRRLDLSGNKFSSPALAPALATHLPALHRLTRLSLDNMAIGAGNAEVLAPPLASLSLLQHLGLDNGGVGPRGATALAEPLQTLTNLHTLNLIGNNLQSDGARVLAPALAALWQLEELRLSCNDIGPLGAAALAEPLSHLSAMQRLRLDRNRLGPEGADALVEPLSHLTDLCFVSLSANRIGSPGCTRLLDTLNHLSRLTTLNLLDNDLPR